MADEPAGGPRPLPDKAWPAPGDTQPIGPVPQPVDEHGRPLPPVQPYPSYPPEYVPVPVPAPGAFGFRPRMEYSAVIALVLAILAYVACPVIAAIAALLIAGGAAAKIKSSGGALTGLGLVTAARWLAWIHIGLLVVGLILMILGTDLYGRLFG